ncbi:hypothetical protein CIB48_g8229 [Xylaria polymorpha]|nr:hypothetical protein CIB48_g8229 [Xylaria polymorpha]
MPPGQLDKNEKKKGKIPPIPSHDDDTHKTENRENLVFYLVQDRPPYPMDTITMLKHNRDESVAETMIVRWSWRRWLRYAEMRRYDPSTQATTNAGPAGR